jgi:hypothetical protein
LRKGDVAKRALRCESSLGRLNTASFEFLLFHGAVELQFVSEVGVQLRLPDQVQYATDELRHQDSSTSRSAPCES